MLCKDRTEGIGRLADPFIFYKLILWKNHIITVEKQYCLLCHAICITHYLYLIVLLSYKNIFDELSEAFDNTLSYLSVFYR